MQLFRHNASVWPANQQYSVHCNICDMRGNVQIKTAERSREKDRVKQPLKREWQAQCSAERMLSHWRWLAAAEQSRDIAIDFTHLSTVENLLQYTKKHVIHYNIDLDVTCDNSVDAQSLKCHSSRWRRHINPRL